MTYLNILEKFKVLFNTLLDFKIILIFSVLLILLTFLYIIKKLNSKRYTKCIILSLIIVLLISILDNQKALSNTFDDFTTMFFRNIYFPSVYTYISMILIILISTIVTLLNKKTNKSYKIINSSVFVLNSILFILILNIIAKNKIDVFSINSLYTNTPLLVTLEISTGLFLIWVSFLLIAYTTNCIIDRMSIKKEITNEVVLPVINIDNNIPQEINISNAYESNIISSNINVPLTENINNTNVELVNTIEPINYIHIPKEENTQKEYNNKISFQDILERISTIEELDGNIDDIDIFAIDDKYKNNEEIKALY